MSSPRVKYIVVIALFVLVGAPVVALKAAHASDRVQSLGMIVATVVLGGPFLFWMTYRVQDAIARDVIEKYHAIGGVPCTTVPDRVWGTLVVTPTSYVWEPTPQQRTRGHEAVQIDDRGRASATFGEMPVGVRRWPAVTITRPGGEPFTVAMSKRSAGQLTQLLTSDPNTTTLW